ncbi:hypothetical protein HMI56_005160 [Coelomomyces lativittatus]|nr:hypothetical protein HMI56_005160 [Coelomomyces lativittatus]
MNLRLRVKDPPDLKGSFGRASNVTWTIPTNFSAIGVYNITANNIALGDWEVCQRKCVIIGMKQWYGVYQDIRGVKIKTSEEMKASEEVKTQNEKKEVKTKGPPKRLNFRQTLEKMENMLVNVLNTAQDMYYKGIGLVRMAYVFVGQDSFFLPAKVLFPYPVSLDGLNLSVKFWLRTKEDKDVAYVDIKSIQNAKIYNLKKEDAFKFNFEPTTKSTLILAKVLLMNTIDHIGNITLVLDETYTFHFFNDIRLHLGI